MIQITVFAYLTYLSICLGLTVWVAHVLFKNAQVFLDEIFKKKEAFSASVSHLLKIGFYLVNFGLILFLLQVSQTINNYQVLVEVLSIKIGTIILLLGALHFANVYLLFKLRRFRIQLD